MRCGPKGVLLGGFGRPCAGGDVVFCMSAFSKGNCSFVRDPFCVCGMHVCIKLLALGGIGGQGSAHSGALAGSFRRSFMARERWIQ